MLELSESTVPAAIPSWARYGRQVAAALGCVALCPWAAADSAVSPFSIGFFPQAGQWEWSAQLGLLESEHRTESLLLRHEGSTITGLLTPGFRWGWRDNLALEVSQPVAHRFQIDPHNPNVGPQGLRAPTLSLVQRLGAGQAVSWRLAGMVQINPWNSSGLNQWGASLTALPHPQASLSLGASRYPETGMSVLSSSGAWEAPLGAWLLQGKLGLARYSAYTTPAARLQASQGWSAGLEASHRVGPGLWAGLSLGVANHSQDLSTRPTAQLPLSLPVSNRTAVYTLALTLRGLP